MGKIIDAVDRHLISVFSMDIADLTRILRLLIVAAVLIVLSDYLPRAVGETVLSPVIFSIAVAVMSWSVGHIIRKMLMPKLDIQNIASKAVAEKDLASAIVFCACVSWYIAIGIGIIILVR